MIHLKLDFIEISRVEFPRCRLIRVLASLSVFLLLFGFLVGSARIANAAGFTLTSIARTETTVTLSWSQSSDVWFYSYTLWFSTSVNGPYSSIWSTGDKGETSYGVSGLSSNTDYYFYVADSGLLVNYNSNTLQVTTASNPQLTVTDYDYSSASLAWIDYNTYSSLEPFVSYTLQMSSSGPSGPWSSVTSITDPSQNNYRQMGLFYQTYWFQLYDTVGPSGNTQPSYSNIVNVTIPFPLHIVITASVTTLDVGQEDQFSSSTTGGVPPYSNYQWHSNWTSIAGATSSSFVFTPRTNGTYYIYASVQDTLAKPVNSNQILVKVNPLPVINISASNSTLTVGQQAQFSSSTTGGATPYSYRWYSNGDPIADATSSSFIFTPTAAGTYNIYATVQDSSNATASSNSIQVTVTSSSSLPLSPMIIAALVVIIIVIIAVGALVLRSRSRNKTQKTK